MWSYSVVDPFPFDELLVERGDGPVALIDLVELLCVRALGPLDRTVELGAFGWQHEQLDATALALALEVRIELLSLHLPGRHGRGRACGLGSYR